MHAPRSVHLVNVLSGLRQIGCRCREAGAVEGPCASSYAARVLCCCFCKLFCTIQQIRWPSSCLGAMPLAQSQQSLKSVCMSCINWKHHRTSWRARWPVRCFSPLSRQQPAPLQQATGPGETLQMNRQLPSLSHCFCLLGSSPQQGRHICGTAYGRPGGASCPPCGTEWRSGAPRAPLPSCSNLESQVSPAPPSAPCTNMQPAKAHPVHASA